MGARRESYLFFGLAMVSLLMFSIDGTVVSVALPNIVADLQTQLVWVGWTLTGFQLAQTATMPLAELLMNSVVQATLKDKPMESVTPENL